MLLINDPELWGSKVRKRQTFSASVALHGVPLASHWSGCNLRLPGKLGIPKMAAFCSKGRPQRCTFDPGDTVPLLGGTVGGNPIHTTRKKDPFHRKNTRTQPLHKPTFYGMVGSGWLPNNQGGSNLNVGKIAINHDMMGFSIDMSCFRGFGRDSHTIHLWYN